MTRLLTVLIGSVVFCASMAVAATSYPADARFKGGLASDRHLFAVRYRDQLRPFRSARSRSQLRPFRSPSVWRKVARCRACRARYPDNRKTSGSVNVSGGEYFEAVKVRFRLDRSCRACRSRPPGRSNAPRLACRNSAIKRPTEVERDEAYLERAGPAFDREWYRRFRPDRQGHHHHSVDRQRAFARPRPCEPDRRELRDTRSDHRHLRWGRGRPAGRPMLADHRDDCPTVPAFTSRAANSEVVPWRL